MALDPLSTTETSIAAIDAVTALPTQKTTRIKPFASTKSFVIDGMDLSCFVPTYYLLSTKTFGNGVKRYYLRSSGGTKLFVNTLYQTMYHFMNYLGYEPTEVFDYVRLESEQTRRGSKDGNVFRSLLLDRLILREGTMIVNKQKLKAKWVVARFFSNEIDLDYGFAMNIGPQTVCLTLFPYVNLTDHEGNTIKPQHFVRNLLLTMNYPMHLYLYQKANGTLTRLIREYHDALEKRDKYEEFEFVRDRM